MRPPKVVVAGGSGFVGRPLCRALWDNGKREVWALSRSAREIPYARVSPWDGESDGPWTECLEGAAALINVCGGDGEGRPFAARVLAQALARCKKPPPVFISASAVRCYGDRGDEELDESSALGADPEAVLCGEWERAALSAPPG